MQICLATDAWSPQINGVVTTLSRTAATLTSWGHRVLLLTPDRFRTVPCPTYPEIRLSLATTAAVSRLLAKTQHFHMHEELGTGPSVYYIWDHA